MRHYLANLAIAATGLTASFTLKEWAQVFAATATGLWFCVQIALALERRFRRRDGDTAPPVRPLRRD